MSISVLCQIAKLNLLQAHEPDPPLLHLQVLFPFMVGEERRTATFRVSANSASINSPKLSRTYSGNYEEILESGA